MDEEIVQKWIKQSNRKKAKLIHRCVLLNGITVYNIVYFSNGKVRVGEVREGMRTRYGIKCRGAMGSTDPLSLWQSEPGACNECDVRDMIDYLNGECKLPDFDFGSIKDLRD